MGSTVDDSKRPTARRPRSSGSPRASVFVVLKAFQPQDASLTGGPKDQTTGYLQSTVSVVGTATMIWSIYFESYAGTHTSTGRHGFVSLSNLWVFCIGFKPLSLTHGFVPAQVSRLAWNPHETRYKSHEESTESVGNGVENCIRSKMEAQDPDIINLNGAQVP